MTTPQPQPASGFIAHSCLSVQCSICAEPQHDDEFGSLYFATREDAERWIREAGWSVDGDTVMCRQCVKESGS